MREWKFAFIVISSSSFVWFWQNSTFTLQNLIPLQLNLFLKSLQISYSYNLSCSNIYPHLVSNHFVSADQIPWMLLILKLPTSLPWWNPSFDKRTVRCLMWHRPPPYPFLTKKGTKKICIFHVLFSNLHGSLTDLSCAFYIKLY